MPLYSCELCKFSSHLKSNYNRHLNTNKHITKSKEMALMNTNEHKRTQNEHKRTQMNTNEHKKRIIISDKIHKCQFCEETFNTIPSKRRHEIHYCKNIPGNHSNIINELKKEKKMLYKQIEKLIDKAGNHNVNIQANTNNVQTNNTQTNNIKLNSYGKEDLSHITDLFKTNLLKMPHGMIPKMIEAVHFNDDKPENKNIKFTNKRDNKIKIFSNDKWIHKSKDETIHDLMDGKYFILDAHYSNLIDNEDENSNVSLCDFYEKFRKLFDERDNELIEQQKKECELILLNNR